MDTMKSPQSSGRKCSLATVPPVPDAVVDELAAAGDEAALVVRPRARDGAFGPWVLQITSSSKRCSSCGLTPCTSCCTTSRPARAPGIANYRDRPGPSGRLAYRTASQRGQQMTPPARRLDPPARAARRPAASARAHRRRAEAAAIDAGETPPDVMTRRSRRSSSAARSSSTTSAPAVTAAPPRYRTSRTASSRRSMGPPTRGPSTSGFPTRCHRGSAPAPSTGPASTCRPSASRSALLDGTSTIIDSSDPGTVLTDPRALETVAGNQVFNRFDIPQLRGINATAPYFHDHRAPLEDVMSHYQRFFRFINEVRDCRCRSSATRTSPRSWPTCERHCKARSSPST